MQRRSDRPGPRAMGSSWVGPSLGRRAAVSQSRQVVELELML
ncbi:MAG TPA: hypothetical protein VMU97_01830 [Candidatus Dormibacteraeota bacterium]|nr:hypothetical protein [Candidatus Dormibacteraeota bacterium]